MERADDRGFCRRRRGDGQARLRPRIAETAADLLLREVRDPDGRLRRSWKDGRALHSGVLEDYANLAEGLLALYEATFNERWFVAAQELADTTCSPTSPIRAAASSTRPTITRR